MAEATPRAWLLRFARVVRQQLDGASPDPLLSLADPRQLHAMESDSNGWYVTIGRLRGVRGELQVWLDFSTVAPKREVSAAFVTRTHAHIITEMGSMAAGRWSVATRFSDADWDYAAGHMRRRLPRHLYRRAIVELYPRAWNFYSMYWPDRIGHSQAPPPALSRQVAEFLGAAVRTASGIAMQAPPDPYPAFRNRAKIAEHLRRDRSAKLALQARIRDQFTCQICGINFARLYGPLGRGFAEVHHRVPLSTLDSSTATLLKDLVTVCANCHRMLHRMSGKAGDVEALKRAHTRKWPRVAG